MHVQAKATCPSLITKTSIMLGMGETDEQIFQTLRGMLDDVLPVPMQAPCSRQRVPLSFFV